MEKILCFKVQLCAVGQHFIGLDCDVVQEMVDTPATYWDILINFNAGIRCVRDVI